MLNHSCSNIVGLLLFLLAMNPFSWKLILDWQPFFQRLLKLWQCWMDTMYNLYLKLWPLKYLLRSEDENLGTWQSIHPPLQLTVGMLPHLSIFPQPAPLGPRDLGPPPCAIISCFKDLDPFSKRAPSQSHLGPSYRTSPHYPGSKGSIMKVNIILVISQNETIFKTTMLQRA